MILPLAIALAMTEVKPPQPMSTVPSERQLEWQRRELEIFIHFGPNTFTDKEWGGGDEDPNLFNPANLDCRQWCKGFKAAGFKTVIITAKHHDGFCLWPSKFSTHTVAQSKWRNGKGDVLKELSEACKAEGLKMGVYLSPWDRNHPKYGTPEYNQTFTNMLHEVLTHYGPIHEVWFDGANGEGPNGKKQVYDWPLFVQQVRKDAPHAVIFSDAGPDIRWVGNEEGWAPDTCWSTVPSGRYEPGTSLHEELGVGMPEGDMWCPAECDVSIRPGWFYHPTEDPKTSAQLFDLYERSVGHNSLLLLNVPPNRQGLIESTDLMALEGLHRLVGETYGHDLARGAKAFGEHSRGRGFEASQVVDGNDKTYWAMPDGANSGALRLEFGKPVTFNRVLLEEFVPLGQRISKFSIRARADGAWQTIGSGTTIGHRWILRVPQTTTSEIEVVIEAARACPTLSRVGVFNHAG